MLKIILESPRYLAPFNERARDLRIQNKPLWLHQRDAGFIDLGSHLIQFPSNQGIWSKSAIVCISRLLFQRS